jgi:hypothetical protein
LARAFDLLGFGQAVKGQGMGWVGCGHSGVIMAWARSGCKLVGYTGRATPPQTPPRSIKEGL